MIFFKAKEDEVEINNDDTIYVEPKDVEEVK